MTLDVLIELPFGMAIERVVRIEGAPSAEGARAAKAKAAMVRLCGGKKVVLLAMPTQFERVIDARVGVPHREPPPGLELNAHGHSWLDVGAAIVTLQAVDFASDETIRLLRASDTR